jgi:chromosome segregation ATPase
MPWYVFELAAYLFVAIAFGIAIGWLIWGDEPFEVSSSVGGGADDEVVADLNSQVESRDQEIVRLRKRLKRMHADLDARDAHVTAAKGQTEELQALLAQRDSELSLAMTSPGEAGELQVRRVAELEEQLAASRNEAGTLARQLQDALQGTFVPAGTDRVDNVDQAELEALQAEYDKLVAAHDSLDRAYSGVSDELAETQARLEEVLNEGPDLAAHDRVRVLEAEVQQLRSDAQTSFRRAQVAEDALLSSRNALARMEQARAEEVGPADDQSEEIESLRQTIAQFQNEQTSLYQQVSDLEQSLVEAQSQPVMAVGGLGSQEADEIRFELSKVQTELARSRQSVTSLRQRLQEVEDENESLAGDLARASNELQTRNSRTSEQSAEQQRLTATLATLREESAGLSTRLASAEQARQQAEQARQQAEQARQQALAAADEAARGLAAQRSENESSLAGLHVELSDARLRADAAYEALEELTQEFVVFRETTLRQQTTMNELAERLDRARTTLVGRAAPVMRPEEEDVIDDLQRLPNMTPTLHAHLLELGVTTYSEIASWTSGDVTRLENMLGEPPRSLAARGWVEAAKSLIADQPQR